jgi:hypothetical protein
VLELDPPVASVAADPVEEKHQLAVAGDRYREPRRWFDENRVQVSLPPLLPIVTARRAGAAVLKINDKAFVRAANYLLTFPAGGLSGRRRNRG